ncbi:unnamed protein product [Ceutorhynchus assimilis]|uniref:Heparanase n=1 Tax=Ceutorhynchus assimilis TaxID=467358 RepID=A0A9N9MTB7_9CUCU|nr:unnamed protein product [Ceutorhynchus assimilis]
MKLLTSLFLFVSLCALVHSLSFTLESRDEPIHRVSEKFLSVALDSSEIEGRYSDFNLSDPYLTKLVSHLSPMYFRIGGTYADRITFSEEESTALDDIVGFKFLASDWLKLYQFTQNANVRLIYDLNSLMRNDDGTWNSENAEKMIKFSSDNQMDVDWELGNEPDLYHSVYNTHVDAAQLAKDYNKLRSLLNKYDIYKSSDLVGIDIFDVGGSQSNQDYLRTFLQGAANAVHAITWHHYYFAGKDATKELFLNPETMNQLEQRINVVTSLVTSNKVWLGETSSAFNGGAANMSNRFIGTFLWLDKLGLGAKLGLDVIIRQTIFHDNYALIDNAFTPNPDWWVSVLYKKLVGTKVLSLSNDGTSANTIRLYAHCAKDNDLWDDSAVVVFGFNTADESASFTIKGLEVSEAYSYEMTAESNLYSQLVKLNGQILSTSLSGDLPAMEPKLLEIPSGSLSLAPYSIGFWVIPNSGIKAC